MLLPRSNGRLAVDIQQYLNRIGLDVPSFVDSKPGKVLYILNCTIQIITKI